MEKWIKIRLKTALFLFILCGCAGQPSDKNMKDLDESMMDLRIYQENLGDHIKSGDLKEGEWLLQGMDSILRVLAQTFNVHRKLSEPFSYSYKKRLKAPIRNIQKAIDHNDTGLARKNYRLLIRNCNSCHIDQDIDKTVKY